MFCPFATTNTQLTGKQTMSKQQRSMTTFRQVKLYSKVLGIVDWHWKGYS